MSTSQKKYKHAPIVEAVLEIRVHPKPGFSPDSLKTLAESLKGDFPRQAGMQGVHLTVGLGAQVGPAIRPNQPSLHGLRLAKSDGSRVLQLRQDGLAYSHMPPYTQWATFRSEAHAFWQQYRAAYAEPKVARCGLRYINRIDIPVPGENIEIYDYFRLYPEIPKALPNQDVVGMSLNLQMPQHDLECMAVINQVEVEPTKPTHLAFILDIDIYRMGLESWQDGQVWEYLEKLRHRKNEIFEACITDRTRELID